jgi:hypothetical protein
MIVALMRWPTALNVLWGGSGRSVMAATDLGRRFGRHRCNAGRVSPDASMDAQNWQAKRTTDKVNVTIGPDAAASNASSVISSAKMLSL